MFSGGASAYISIENALHNLKIIRAHLPKSSKLMCVIKANAYGHGAVRLSSLYESMGADFFGVSTLAEACELRKSGIKLPILILGYTPPEYAGELFEYGISQCVFSSEYATMLSEAAQRVGARIKIHIKIDTGMSRIGFPYNIRECAFSIYNSLRTPYLVPEGIFTHFSSADFDKEFTALQYERFLRVSNELCELGFSGLIRHAANSAAVISYPEYALDMARVGIILYGIYPSDGLIGRLDLRQVMTLCAPVSLVKRIRAGDSVGYSRKFTAKRDMTLATVQIGYADGVFRHGSCGKASFTVAGKDARVVGNICMDQLMLDVSDINGVKMGDTVTLFGIGGKSAEKLAGELGTIGYELTAAVGARVPRVYV